MNAHKKSNKYNKEGMCEICDSVPSSKTDEKEKKTYAHIHETNANIQNVNISLNTLIFTLIALNICKS